jgi:hypothetical protein
MAGRANSKENKENARAEQLLFINGGRLVGGKLGFFDKNLENQIISIYFVFQSAFYE